MIYNEANLNASYGLISLTLFIFTLKRYCTVIFEDLKNSEIHIIFYFFLSEKFKFVWKQYF